MEIDSGLESVFLRGVALELFGNEAVVFLHFYMYLHCLSSSEPTLSLDGSQSCHIDISYSAGLEAEETTPN